MFTLPEIRKYIAEWKFVYLKVSIVHSTVTLEVLNHNGERIEEHSVSLDRSDEKEIDRQIEDCKLMMLSKAGEYANSGYFPIINPFTN
jgi:hypothetical protein